jgi:uncharacterized membrane-anchored protein
MSMLTLKPRHAPANDVAFWAALCLASILGCNTGDYFASFFGFLSGLPALLIGFAIVVGLERRDGGDSKAFYWFAIILVRTAATNLADFVAHQIGVVEAMAGLAALLLAVMLLTRVQRGAVRGGLPAIDGRYWITMLIAGTLGTAAGDFASFKTGLGLGGASIALSLLVALLVAIRMRAVAIPLSYWLIVVAIRTAGTSVGDWFAHAIGLWQSTAAFSVLLIAFLSFVPRRGAPVPTT